MFAQVLGFIMKSKGAKLGVGALGGSGVLVLVMSLHADITNRIEAQDFQQRERTILMLAPIETEIANLKSEQRETKDMVRDIHNHLLNK